MSQAQADQRIDIETVEEMVRRLAAAVSTLRIYAPHHGRAIATVESFLAMLRPHVRGTEGRPPQPFTLLCSNGILLHESIPLGSEDSIFGQLALAIEARGYKGLTFQTDFTDDAVRELIQWLSERLAHPLSRTLVGILMLVEDGEGLEGGSGGGTASPHSIADFRIPDQIHLLGQQVLERARRSLESGRGMDFKEIVELTRWVADVATEKGNQLVAPTQLRCHDLYTFHHSVNVFLVSTALLQPFARDRDELAIFAQAALLHDIGKTRTPYEILHKRGRLTDEEFAVIREHPVHGAEILLEGGAAHPLAVEVAYTHHMRDDGYGYPEPAPGTSPSLVSRIIQVADMFEALTAHRPYKQGHSAWDAIDIILKTPGMTRSRGICAHLIERLTQSPPGSEVVLSTGERATVVETFQDAPDRPRVRVIEDVDGNRLEHPVEVDLREMAGDQPIREVCLKPVLARPTRASLAADAVAPDDAQAEPIEIRL